MAGYNGFSKSNSAVEAEDEGRYPLTKASRIIARATGITIKEARVILEEIGTSEYHHSSKFFNCIDYYDTTEPIQVIKHMNAGSFESYRAAKNDLEEKESDEDERDAAVLKYHQNKCKHEFVASYSKGGGMKFYDHHRCPKCGKIEYYSRENR